MKLSEAKIDSSRLEAGDWVKNIPDMGDLELKVRGLGNADYRRRQAALFRTLPRSGRAQGVIDPADADRIEAILLVETVLVDWRGLIGDDDQPIPYSKEFAQKLLTEPDYRPFRAAVAWAASVVAEGLAEDRAADAKN
jgi:hypothetical protein